MSQEKLQTMVMQRSWGVLEVYYGIVQVVNWQYNTNISLFNHLAAFSGLKYKGVNKRQITILNRVKR